MSNLHRRSKCCISYLLKQYNRRIKKQKKSQTRVQMSMLPTGTVLPRIPLRCSFKFSDKNRSMSIYSDISTLFHCIAGFTLISFYLTTKGV